MSRDHDQDEDLTAFSDWSASYRSDGLELPASHFGLEATAAYCTGASTIRS
jgi:hypothetical protein